MENEPKGWRPVADAPDDGREVLACFRGQFSWVKFIARAYPASRGGVHAPGYAKPEFWMPMPEDPQS